MAAKLQRLSWSLLWLAGARAALGHPPLARPHLRVARGTQIHGQGIRGIEMKAPFDVCWENNKNRNRTIPEKDFQMIWESLEPVAEEKEDPRWDKIFSCKWGEEGVEVLR